MNALEQAVYNIGYVRCPNSPTRWYAGGPGILECASGFDLHISGDHAEVLPAWWRSSRPVAVATFYTVRDLVDWLALHGQVSAPGTRQPDWID